MKRKASGALADFSQGILTYAHDGKKQLNILYSENGSRISRFDQVPPYGTVLVNGKDAEMIIFRLEDGSILCMKSSPALGKLRDQFERSKSRRWCHNYTCLHISNACDPESKKMYKIDGKNPYSLSRLDCHSYGNIRHYMTNTLKSNYFVEKPECRFKVPVEYGGNGKEGILNFPLKMCDFEEYVTRVGMNILLFLHLFERETFMPMLNEIYYQIITYYKPLFTRFM